MANELISTVAVSTTLGAALVAGIFFAFSTFIMTALSRLLPEQGIAAMQSINVAVLNPWFLAVFFGTALGSIALALLGILNWGAPGSTFLVSGCLLYLIGCILVTIVFNVPLNHALAAVEPQRVPKCGPGTSPLGLHGITFEQSRRLRLQRRSSWQFDNPTPPGGHTLFLGFRHEQKSAPGHVWTAPIWQELM